MIYPYNLQNNPFPSSPTPTIYDASILGGEKHKEAKNAIVTCIEELYSKINIIPDVNTFRVITIIQDVGSGKTHLALHIKYLYKTCTNAIISYIDLAQIKPKNFKGFFSAFIKGFPENYNSILKETIISTMRKKLEENIFQTKKLISYNFFDRILGKSVIDKLNEVLKDGRKMSLLIDHLLDKDFLEGEITILKNILNNSLYIWSESINSQEEVIEYINAITKINMKFLNKLTLFEIDEFESDIDSLEFVKAVMNSHIQFTVLLLILTPSSYDSIRKKNVSVFDRLEKANYKIDLAGSNTLNEISDIIFQYIRAQNCNFTLNDEKELKAKLKVIYDEFPDFRNIRSMINILHHSTENAKISLRHIIDEKSIDDTIKLAYPGLRIKGSIMDVPIAEFIKIRKISTDCKLLQYNVKEAVRDLVNYVYEIGNVAKPQTNGCSKGIDILYDDFNGTKVAVAIVINDDHRKSFEIISDALKTTFADRIVVLTNSYTDGIRKGVNIVNIDKSKIIDLLYFSNKYQKKEISNEDPERVLLLAKSIKICQ